MPAHISSMDDLLERRAYECRLTPDRALDTLDDAEGFLRDRGLLTRTADSALPSLFEACHEEPYAPDKPGFGQWPRTKYPWFGGLGARGYRVLAVHRGKNLLVTDDVARLIDPIARAEIRRMEEADEGWARLLQPPRRCRAVRARGPPAGARAQAEGAEAPAHAARALRRDRVAQHRVRGAAPAHERARALGPAVPGAGGGRRHARADRSGRARGGRRACARGSALVLLAVVLGRLDPGRRAARPDRRLRHFSGNGFRARAGKTCAVTQTGVTA